MTNHAEHIAMLREVVESGMATTYDDDLNAAASAIAALVAERDALRMCAEAGGELLKTIDTGRMRQRVGVTGQTMDAQLRASVYDGVPAYPIEEAREKYVLALASLSIVKANR